MVAIGCADDTGVFSVDTRAADGTSAAVVAYQNGARWGPAWPTTPGVFAVPAGSDVTLVVACRSAQAQVEARYLVAEPGATVAVPCWGSFAPVPVHPATFIPADVTVSAGRPPRGLGDPSGILAPAGIWDVVVATSDQVLIRRGVPLPPSSPLTFDVTADGTPLQPVAVELPLGDPASETDPYEEYASASYVLHTAGGTRGYLPPADGLRAVPETLLVDGDEHAVTVSLHREYGWSRSVTTYTRDLARIDTALPDPIDRIETSPGSRSVSWQGAPPGDLHLHVLDEAATWSVIASEAWLAENGGTGAGTWWAPDLVDVTGWDPAWSLDGRGLEHDWNLSFVSTVDEGDRVVVRTARDDGFITVAP